MPAERGVLCWEIKVAHVHYIAYVHYYRTIATAIMDAILISFRLLIYSRHRPPFSCQSAIRLYEAVLTIYRSLIMRYV